MPKLLPNWHRYPQTGEYHFRYHLGIVDYGPKARPNWLNVYEVYDWCEEHFGVCEYELTQVVGGRWYHGTTASFYFNRLEDVMQVKLRFSDWAVEFTDHWSENEARSR